MLCKDVRQELIAFHFGTVPAEQVAAIEEHLLECKECLRMFLLLKRSVGMDLPREQDSQPSAAVQLHLRKKVAERFRRPFWTEVLGWLRTPIPLYQGAVVLLVMVGAVGAVNRMNDSRNVIAPAESGIKTQGIILDTSEQAPGMPDIS